MRSSVDVHNFLVERDVPHELFPLRGRLRTPGRLAAVLELPPEQVGHVVVLEAGVPPGAGGGPVAALVAADRKPSLRRVARALRLSPDVALQRAAPDRASALAEYLTEAIPPAGLPDRFRVVIDRPLAREEVVYFPAGESRSVLKVRGEDLARAVDATVAAISART
jgi:prolyl-tRNA editing enzyme YbaK/EbsC (Cys-tRNA(Pro) deacylase)